MRRVAHLSDLHFGTEEPSIVRGLLHDLHELQPQLIVVSGDLTQRARRNEFLTAREFLDRLPQPVLVVPGNHDIPLYNLAARFGWPLAGYRRAITNDLRPNFRDEELAVAGVNTARSNTWKDGRISREDIVQLQRFFTDQPRDVCKILAAHHPFIPPVHDPTAALVGRSSEALRMLDGSGCHLILSGHLHQAYASDVRPHHVEVKRSILAIQAGTATSHRRRAEANAFNLLTVDWPRLELDVRTWSGDQFATAGTRRWSYGRKGWSEVN